MALQPPPVSTAGLPPNLGGGEQPKSRLSDPAAALNLVKRRVQALGTKWDVWNEVAKKYDCEPPDDPQQLRADGLGHSTNVCWGTMEARVDEIVETYYNLANGGSTFLRFHSRVATPQAAKALKTLSLEHKILWDSWNGRQELMETLVHNRSLYPFSAVYYDMPTGWHGKALHPRNLIYPEGASSDPDQWFWCAVRTSFEAWQLLEKLSKEKEASDVGWKPAAIRKACELFCREGGAFLSAIAPGMSWATLDWDRHRTHDLVMNDRIPAFVVYVKEWDGRISEHILVDHTEVGYIYSKIGKHTRLSNTLRVFTHGLGNGTLDGSRSYGIKTLQYHDALDRLTNAEFDTALITSSLILQADGGTTLDKLSELVFNVGGVTAIPSGFSPAQVSFRDSAAGMRLLKQDLRQQLQRNTPALAGDVEVGDYEKSAREAAMVYQSQLQLGLFKVDRFRTQMNGFCETHWRRLLDCIPDDVNGPGASDAREFFKMAARLGVDPDLVKTIYRVTHRTGSARGNRVNAQLGMDRSRQYFGMFSEEGKRAFARADIELALDDDENADLWFGGNAPADADSEQRRLAQLENSSLAGGVVVQASGTDFDLIHMGEHTQWLGGMIAACQQGQVDPATCLRSITLAIQHVQGHFARLQQDKFAVGYLKQLAEQWSQFENQRRQLQQQLEEQAMAAQQAQIEAMRTPPLDPKDAQKLAFGQLEMQQSQETHQQRLQQDAESHALDIAAKKAKLNDGD